MPQTQKGQKENFALMLERIAINLLNIYQTYISGLLPGACRFFPSCSEYAKQAILKHGFLKGGLKALKRLLLCQSFSGRGGFDPLV